MKIIEWLKLPETRGISDLDDPATTLLHAKIIQGKPFLKRLYTDFYNEFKTRMPKSATGMLVELGSGGGFIKEVIPDVITSDIAELPNVDMHFSALEIPFEDNRVSAYFMINLLHHIEDSRAFFKELERSLKIGGKIIMIEPFNTPWSRFVHQNFHHETFDPKASWGFKRGGRLSSANGAIPWIIFCRDRMQFEKEFPSLKIRKLEIHTPFRYLISGGVSFRQLVPSCAYGLVKGIEGILSPLNKYLGMYMTVELEKVV